MEVQDAAFLQLHSSQLPHQDRAVQRADATFLSATEMHAPRQADCARGQSVDSPKEPHGSAPWEEYLRQKMQAPDSESGFGSRGFEEGFGMRQPRRSEASEDAPWEEDLRRKLVAPECTPDAHRGLVGTTR